MSDNWIPIVAITAVFGSVGYVGFLIVDGLKFRQRALQAREFQQKLLDRVSSPQDLAVVLNSEGTAKLLTSLTGPRMAGPEGRILRAIQSGVVLAMLGASLFLYAWFTPRLGDDGQQVTTLFATIALALGLGFTGAGGAAYAMSRRMGIIERDGARTMSSL